MTLDLKQILFLSVTLFLSSCDLSDQNCDPALDCGCGSTTDCAMSEQDILQSELSVNQEKWQQLQLSNYSFDLKLNCFCIGGNDYSVYRSEYADLIFDLQLQQFSNDVYASESYSLHDPTALYDLIENSIWDADLLKVNYDTITGLPVNIKIDKAALSSDDELGIEITNILTRPGSNCTDEQLAGLHITVLDRATGTNISLQATALVHNVVHSEYLVYEVSDNQGQLTGLHQKAGRFEATITSPGFVDKHMVEIDVMRNVCHSKTRQLTIELEPVE